MTDGLNPKTDLYKELVMKFNYCIKCCQTSNVLLTSSVYYIGSKEVTTI